MGTPEHFDCVVVGSGFGGSVTAQRLAEADRSVLVLERGKAYPPGSFPRSPHGIQHNLWDPSKGLHGMFDVWSFSDISALVCSGLGGGSLIYANVLLRKDEHWFDPVERWPLTRRDLDPHYAKAEAMLDAQRFPFEHAPYDATAKTIAFKAAAEARGLDWQLPPLAVTFANHGQDPVPGEPIREAQRNLHGRTRTTCRLCGECDVGCNYGAKNTLDYTYLTSAWHAGAELRTRCEVRSFAPLDGGGWSVEYVQHDEAAEGHETDTRALRPIAVTARDLVLSAGTFGSTYLLLRNRAALPGLSARLGEGFSGNGDLLTFALRATQPGPDGRPIPRPIDAAHGPVITSAIRMPDALDGGGATGRGFYLEDAGYPEFLSWILQLADEPAALLKAVPLLGRWAERLIQHGDAEIGGDVSALLGDCAMSNGTLPLLGMGRDVPDGRMGLGDDGLLELDWSKDGASHDYFDRLRETSEAIAKEMGADFVDNPLWLLDRVITVHPLGGARMGTNDQEGVVDPYGNVFNHPGLHVADGSVMPGPVGPNPSLTIAALADRFADAMLEGAPAPAARRPVQAPSGDGQPVAHGDGAAPSDAVSLSFTEEMKGFCTFDELDFDRGYRDGRKQERALMFHLTITATDMARFLRDTDHEAVATGWVECDELGGRLPVTEGRFNLFVDQDGSRERKRMFYRLPFTDGTGHPLTLTGFKEVRDDPGFDTWADTTTLFTRVLRGHVETEQDAGTEVVASGILHIHPLDFARQMTTFRVHPAERVDALARFGALFAGDLWDVYRPKQLVP